MGIITFIWLGCATDTPPEISTTHVQPDDFAEEMEVSVKLTPGLQLSLWAPGPLLHNAVSISLDDQGIAYVSETNRRKSSDIDIREHRDWMTEDLSLQSVEETKDFHKNKLDPARSDENRWMEDFNNDGSHDWRDLEVQTEVVRRIRDTDGDGRADVSNIFADGFNDLITGVAAGILAWDDDIFLTAAPDLWRLKDINADGIADQKQSLSYGYGIHIAFAGHDMSGLTMGPDGKLYWSIGDMGLNVTAANGKQWSYPHEGAIMRCNPDGSDFEVFARGLRNPQELAFDRYGNLISVDNDGDHADEHERFIHILQGSDTGWRIYWQYGKYRNPGESYKVWMDEGLHLPYFPGQAAYLLPPLALAPDGPAGLAYNPGAALGDEWQDHFFASYFTASSANSKIQAFRLELKGASYEVLGQQDVLVGIVPTGITFGPDGALYINDWKDSYDKKPEGRIWKLDIVPEYRTTLREETASLFREGIRSRTDEELQALLSHHDMRIRLKAQFELVQRGNSQVLQKVAEDQSAEISRLHGIWGLGQLMRQTKFDGESIISLLSDDNLYVRAQSAKVLGENQVLAARSSLQDLLKDSSDYVVMHAAEALGKVGDGSTQQALVETLEAKGISDSHLRHAVTYALSRIGNPEALGKLANHPSSDVRLGAVVALRHLRSPHLASYLLDKEALVATEAAMAIHDDHSVMESLAALSEQLTETTGHNEAFLRRAINANLRIGTSACANRLVIYAKSESAPLEMRLDALWALGYWPAPPLLDRVEGRYRELPRRDAGKAIAALSPHLDDLLASPNEIRAATLELIGRLSYSETEETVASFFKDQQQPVTVRLKALGAIIDLAGSQVNASIRLALGSDDQTIRELALEKIEHLGIPADQKVSLLEIALQEGSNPEKQKALRSLGIHKSAQATSVLNAWLDQLDAKSAPPELHLDILEAAQKNGDADLINRVDSYFSNSDGLMASYASSLYGGNASVGRRIFYRNPLVQCIRCHQVDARGGEVGPDLSHIAKELDREELLASMVEPNARIAPGYGNTLITLVDGSQMAGTIREGNDTIQIYQANGEVKVVLAKEVKSREDLPSAMVPVITMLSRSEIRDLVEFLTTLK